jgi:hypothetical protein
MYINDIHLQIVTGEKVCVTGKTETTIKYLKVEIGLLFPLQNEVHSILHVM